MWGIRVRPPSFCAWSCTFLPGLSGDDFQDVARPDDGEFNADFDDVLRNIDALIGPEPADDHPDSRDTSTWDKQTIPILSPIVEPGEGAGQYVPQSSASLPTFPPTPTSPHQMPASRPSTSAPPPRISTSPSPVPQSPPNPRRGKRKESIVGKAWNRLKMFFVKRFGGGDPSPKLSDKLSPEPNDDGRRYESLFPGPPNLAKTRKRA